MNDQTLLIDRATQPERPATLVEYTVGDLKIEITAQKAFVNGKRVATTPKNFLILHTLALRIHEKKNPLVLKNELLFVLYGAKEHWPKSNSSQVLVNRLRGALSDARSQWKIVPVRTKGYELRTMQ